MTVRSAKRRPRPGGDSAGSAAPAPHGAVRQGQPRPVAEAASRHPGLQFGARLRALRRQRQMALTALARRAGLSPGYLSLVERDLATPSTTALARLAATLDVPMSSLFASNGQRTPDSYVVRRRSRRVLIYPDSPVRNELLVPDLRGKLEAVYFRARPHTKSPTYSHDGEDFGHVLRGRLRVVVGDDVFTLEQGDSISFPSHIAHHWETLTGGAEAIWVATPPSW